MIHISVYIFLYPQIVCQAVHLLLFRFSGDIWNPLKCEWESKKDAIWELVISTWARYCATFMQQQNKA